MKLIISIYSEGFELKVSVLERIKDKIIIRKTFEVRSSGSSSVDTTDSLGNFTDDAIISDDLSFDSLNGMSGIDNQESSNTTEISELANQLAEFDLSKAEFIPVITDPNLTFHIYEGLIEKDKKKTLEKIISEIYNSKGLLLTKDQIDFISLDEKTHLCVFTEPNVVCANLVSSVAAIIVKDIIKYIQ